MSEIDAYLAEVEHEDPLSREEQFELGRRMRQGDEEARKRFIRANVRLATHVAFEWWRKVNPKHLSVGDLIGYAHEGLIKAVDKYDPERGNSFATMGKLWIEDAVRQAVKYKEREIRSYDSYWVDAASRSLDRPVFAEDDGDVQPVADGESVETPTTSESHRSRSLERSVSQQLAKLAPLEREVYKLRYGILDGVERKPTRIGTILRVRSADVQKMLKASREKLWRNRP